MVGPCLLQLVAFVVTFKGPESIAPFTSQNKSISSSFLSFVIQFKTSQPNTRLMAVNNSKQMFYLQIKYGFLQIVYNFPETGNGTISLDFRAVNTNEWFLLNITSLSSSKSNVRLTKSTNIAPLICTAKYNKIVDVNLLGNGFLKLFQNTGLRIGGGTGTPSLKPLEGCVGYASLGGYLLKLHNQSLIKEQAFLNGDYSGISAGCACPVNAECKHGVFMWDQAVNTCLCKCSLGYHGDNCQNKTLSKDDDDIDVEFVAIVSSIAAGALIFVICIVCCILHFRGTSSSAFGVYNPRQQEKVHGQQLQTAFTIPLPEKLI